MPYYNNVNNYHPYNNWNNNYTNYNRNWNNNWNNNYHNQWGNGWTAQNYATRWYPGWNAYNYRWDGGNNCWRVYLRQGAVYITVFVTYNYGNHWHQNGYLW